MRDRYYNPEIKRFINQDILTGNIGNVASLNRYSYVEGNPVSYTDPFGLSPYNTISQVIHSILHVAGVIPGWIGHTANAINGTLYLFEGNYKSGLLSLIYAIPFSELYDFCTNMDNIAALGRTSLMFAYSNEEGSAFDYTDGSGLKGRHTTSNDMSLDIDDVMAMADFAAGMKYVGSVCGISTYFNQKKECHIG